jgi:N-acetylglucosamine-6-sulfatase
MKKLLLAALFVTSIAFGVERPNVLFILCDDLRWDAVPLGDKTPNIARLAREGVRFKNAFCTTSLCSPSRASILSGLYAHSHGVVNNFTEYPTNMVSWPMRLRETGYASAYVGKWHMGEDNDAPRPGFDWFVTHKGQGKYFGTEWNINGTRRETTPGYYTGAVTDFALDWLKQQRKPWALCLGHKAPHSFYTPEEKYAHAFDNVRVPYPDTAFHLDDKPAWIKQRLRTWHGIYGPLFDWRKKFPDDRPEAVKDFENMTHAYWSTILSVDDSVGRLLKHLEDTKQLDRTIIVFMGDNGLLNGEHGMVDKRTMHEPSIRVPILVRAPGLKPGVVEQMVLTEDIAPSLLDLCGAKPLPNIHGKSWKRLAQRGDPSWRTAFFYEYNYEKQFPYTPNVRGVRTDDWKYIHYPHGDGSPDRHMAELYNLKADPDERRNLINDPACAGKLAELKAELVRQMKLTGLVRDTMPLDEGVKQELPAQSIR